MAESGAWLLVLGAVLGCSALKVLLPSCSSAVSDVTAPPRRPLAAGRHFVTEGGLGRGRPGRGWGVLGCSCEVWVPNKAVCDKQVPFCSLTSISRC